MSAPFPFAAETDADAAEAARKVARGLRAQSPGGAPLGVVYMSAEHAKHADAIVDTLQAATGVDAWTGAVGMGVIAGDDEHFGRPALAAMLLDLPADAAQPFGPIDSDAALNAAAAQAERFAGDLGTALALVHIDPTGDPTGRGVGGLPGELAEAGGLYLVGGLCSGHEDMPAISSRGGAPGAATGALISLEAGVATGVSQGCASIGPPRELTTASPGVIATLGDMSAFEALLDDLELPPDASTDVLRTKLGGLQIALPVKGADVRDYLVRNITGLDLEQGLVGVAEAVEDGDTAFFCRRDAASAAKDLADMAASVRRRLGGPPRGAIYVSCLARGPNLFGPNGEEVAIVRQALGVDCPVVGFFANGEIAHDRLYGYTGVLTAFS